MGDRKIQYSRCHDLRRVRRIGGTQVTIEDTRVWTNSLAIKQGLMQEKEGGVGRNPKGLKEKRGDHGEK